MPAPARRFGGLFPRKSQRVMARLKPIVFMLAQSVASEGQEYFSGLTFLGLWEKPLSAFNTNRKIALSS
jgi:hypothetical protein